LGKFALDLEPLIPDSIGNCDGDLGTPSEDSSSRIGNVGTAYSPETVDMQQSVEALNCFMIDEIRR
jgi:hypothetical protein